MSENLERRAPEDGGEGPNAGRPLSREELSELESLLANRREFLRGNVQSLEEQSLRTGIDGGGDHSSVPLHAADLATDAYLLDMSLSFMESESDRIREIDDALERLRDGTFGRCESCDQAVALERLRAVPYARFCLACQTERERDEQGR